MPYIKKHDRAFYDEKIVSIIENSQKGRVDKSSQSRKDIEDICDRINVCPFDDEMGHLNYVLSKFINDVLIQYSDDVCYNLLDAIYGCLSVMENALCGNWSEYWLGWKVKDSDDVQNVEPYTLIHRGIFSIIERYIEKNKSKISHVSDEIMFNHEEPDFFGRRLVGCIGCVKEEFYRRVVTPYEDRKMKENGDVYDFVELMK